MSSFISTSWKKKWNQVIPGNVFDFVLDDDDNQSESAMDEISLNAVSSNNSDRPQDVKMWQKPNGDDDTEKNIKTAEAIAMATSGQGSVNPWLNYLNAGTQLAGVLYGVYSDYKNRQLSNKVLNQQIAMDDKSLEFANKQFNESVRQYDLNFFAEQQAMQQSQSNFENAYQIQASDMQKAGLNPLNAGNASGFVQSFSGGSGVSGSVNGSSVGNNQVNSQIGIALAQIGAQAQLTKSNNETAKEIARINASASKYSADKQAETAGAVLEQRKKEFTDNLSLSLSELDEKKRVAKVEEDLKRLGLQESIAKRKAEMLAHDEDIRKAYYQIELEKKKLEQAKDLEEKRLHQAKINTWLQFASDRINNIVDVGKTLLNIHAYGQ